MANLKEFIESVRPEQVDNWWANLAPERASEEVERNNWKYSVIKNGKQLPFKWVVIELGKYFNYPINSDDFSSNSSSRNLFCEAYGFDMIEKVIYDSTELEKFKNYYQNRIKYPNLFKAFIQYCNSVVIKNQIDAYKIRTAITGNNEIMLIIGMKSVLSYQDVDGGAEVSFIVSKEFQEGTTLIPVRPAHFFNGTIKNYSMSFLINGWDELSAELLDNNSKVIVHEFELTLKSKKSLWNEKANTTNSVIKYLIYNNESADELMHSVSKALPDIISDFKNWLLDSQDHLSDSTERNYTGNVEKFFVENELEEHKTNFTRGNFTSLIEIAKSYKDKIDGFGKSAMSYFIDYLFEKLNRKYWALGFDTKKEGASLNDFIKNDFWDALHYEDDDKRGFVLKAFNDFISIKKNDFVLIKGYGGSSDLRVHYIGKVIGKDEEKHTLKFKNLHRELYSGKSPKGSGGGNWFNTILNVHRKEDIKLLFNEILLIDTKSISDLQIQASNHTQNNMAEHPLNQILFGPPGTGKTYNSINKALMIVESITEEELWKKYPNREAAKAKFDEYLKNGQIAFTTFHQSMSYEDFIEGIKPKLDEEEGIKQISYEIQDGIFKTLANKAKDCFEDAESFKEYTFEDAWFDLVEECTKSEVNYELSTLTMPNGLEITSLTDFGNLKIKPKSNIKTLEYTVSFGRLSKLNEAYPDLTQVRNIEKEFRSVIGGMNATAYWAVLNNLNERIQLKNKAIKPFKSGKLKRFVLIIDEINRGNVSQIFGELITLIEDDKRIGKAEALEVILPYSKKKFGVPQNVYIIGTMNTADRSVEALDTALRRRFVFEEMLPRPSVIPNVSNVEGVSISYMLEKINKRIEMLLDKDHQIGHAFFMNVFSVEELKSVFENKIIPLLQEYFYGDFGKIGLVLGNSFIKKDEAIDDFALFDHYDQSLREDLSKSCYQFTDKSVWDFKSI